MRLPLPTSGFEWLDLDGIQKMERMTFGNRKLPEGAGCALEVDLHIPEDLHDHFADYPLAPERTEVNGVEKLMQNLTDKRKYVISYHLLLFYLRQGLELKKVHR